ncbi:MAG: SBBP repeat-containing protein [Bdellovibrionia bacterium]
MYRLLAALFILLVTPFSAYAFLGMNAGATLQGALPAWTRQLGAQTKAMQTYAQSAATDNSGNIFVAGTTGGGLDGNTLTGTKDFFVTKYNSAGTKQWTRQLGVDSQGTYGKGVATDSSGNVFVAGYTVGGLDGNTLTGFSDFFVTKYDSTGVKLWTRQLGVASQSTYGLGVAADSSGNVFVTGYTDGGLDGNTLTGTTDFFVTKYDSAGTKQWTRQLGVASQDTEGNGVATDSSGNVFVSGYTGGGLDGNALTGTTDFFVTKYDSTGAKLWTRQLGVASKTTTGNGVATDSSGNVYVAGETNGGLDGNTLTGTSDFFITKYNSAGTKQWTRQRGSFGPTTLSNAVAAADASGNLYIAGTTDSGLDGNTLNGTQDFFVTKYDSSGAKQWTRQLGVASKSTQGNGVATDSSGNVFVTGSTDGGLDGNTLTGAGDFFVTKYNSSGTKQWTRQLGVASKSTQGNRVATDSSGNVFVAGYTYGGLDGNTLTGLSDFFVTKYNSAGTKQWTRQLGVASKSTFAFGVATDSSGNVFVAGFGTGGLDGNTLTGTNDFFVTKYDSTGAKQWTRQLGVASKATQADAVATDSSGNVFVAGYTYGGLDGNTLTGFSDFFVTKYDSTGAKLWTKQLGVASKSTQGYAAATDSTDNVFVAGYTYGGLDGNTLTGTSDFFVSKFTGSGIKQWTKQMGTPSRNTYANGIAVDSSGRLYVSGTTKGGLDFNALMGAQDFFACQYIGD